MKKFLLLSLILLVPAPQAQALVPLSAQSKNFMLASALVGGALGGTIGGLIYADKKNNTPEYLQDKTSWYNIKNIVSLSQHILIPALIGAALVGGASYFFTYEKYTQAYCKELIDIQQDPAFKGAKESINLDELKADYFKEPYPRTAIFKKLDGLYDALSSLRDRFRGLLHSGVRPIVNVAQRCLDTIDGNLNILKQWLNQIKNDPQYLQEINALSNQIKAEAQKEAAQAAKLAAQAQWAKVFQPRPLHTIVVAK